MTRQRGAVRHMLGRIGLGWTVAVLALAFIAPQAGADPQSDAVGAIDAAWAAAGGEESQLGAKSGDVQTAGAGFTQDFAGGAIFFTPDTGARLMYGPILDKYRELGGPADSDLGFPTIDEGPGRISPDSRNSTFSAADQPVIFWTPDTGAWVVRGAINAAWDALGGSAGTLGPPVAEAVFDGDLVSQKFAGGQISFNSRTREFSTDPADLATQLGDVTVPGDAASAINTAYRASGGAAGPLGARQGDPFAIGADGMGQSFAGGKIFFSPAVGAHAVSGAILEKYEAAGGPTGDLGFPNAGEADGGVPGSRVSSFAAQDNPMIFWTPEHGAVIVRGAMKTAWDKLGAAAGTLGVPLSDQVTEGDVVTQKFGAGQLSFDAKSQTFSSEPANLAESLGEVPVTATAPTSAPPPAPKAKSDNTFAWHNWWLWWIVPLALLLLASLVAWLTGRRRRAGAQSEVRVDLSEAQDVQEAPRWSAADDRGDDSHSWSPAADDEPAPRAWEEQWETGSAGAHSAGDVDDPDAVDTAPTRVEGDSAGDSAGRHAAAAINEPGSYWQVPVQSQPVAGAGFEPLYEQATASEHMEPDIHHHPPGEADEAGEDFLYGGFADEPREEPRAEEHAEEHVGHAVPPPAIHLPLDDPAQPPEGYPVKANMARGTYHLPGGASYQAVVADIWFLDAEHAEANGFTRSDADY